MKSSERRRLAKKELTAFVQLLLKVTCGMCEDVATFEGFKWPFAGLS